MEEIFATFPSVLSNRNWNLLFRQGFCIFGWGVVVGRVVPSGSSFYSGTMSKAHFSPGSFIKSKHLAPRSIKSKPKEAKGE